jgi:hypothetical protein
MPWQNSGIGVGITALIKMTATSPRVPGVA